MKKQKQSGGTIIGFIIGVVVGLGSALAVAVYVTKVPIPFTTAKTQASGADHDAAENQKKQGLGPEYAVARQEPGAPPHPCHCGVRCASRRACGRAGGTAPGLCCLPSPPRPKPEAKPSSATAATADPLGDLAKAKAKAAGSTVASAAPAAPVGLGRLPSRLNTLCKPAPSAPRTTPKPSAPNWPCWVWRPRSANASSPAAPYNRVRMGPYAKRDDAERAKDKLESAGNETTWCAYSVNYRPIAALRGALNFCAAAWSDPPQGVICNETS